MKFLRVGEVGAERPAVLDREGRYRDISSIVYDITPATIGAGLTEKLSGVDLAGLPELDPALRIGPCIGDLRRFFCIGLNYRAHAAETGAAIPSHPIVFMKVCAPSGANDPILIPRDSQKTDWEVELGVVIGRRASHVAVADALDHVACHCLVDDVSERAFQKDFGGQWVKGKSCDSFGPIGPWLVSKDEISDPQNLDLFLDVNGERRQTGNTGDMIFPVAEIVAHLSRFITLLPGDLISTGTPAGVGMGMQPPRYLAPGDTVRLAIPGLGEQNHDVV
jgi:2,4-diketo-3-deoxy-L-fuconate hydrolase